MTEHSNSDRRERHSRVYGVGRELTSTHLRVRGGGFVGKFWFQKSLSSVQSYIPTLDWKPAFLLCLLFEKILSSFLNYFSN